MTVHSCLKLREISFEWTSTPKCVVYFAKKLSCVILTGLAPEMEYLQCTCSSSVAKWLVSWRLGRLQDADATLVGLECNTDRHIPRVLENCSRRVLEYENLAAMVVPGKDAMSDIMSKMFTAVQSAASKNFTLETTFADSILKDKTKPKDTHTQGQPNWRLRPRSKPRTPLSGIQAYWAWSYVRGRRNR